MCRSLVLLPLFSLLSACSGAAPTPGPAAAVAPQVAPPVELPVADRKPESPLVPSPKEMDVALDKAGVAKGLSGLVLDAPRVKDETGAVLSML